MSERKTATEALCRDLMGHVSVCWWCERHGVSTEGTSFDDDRRRALADIRCRIAKARRGDEEALAGTHVRAPRGRDGEPILPGQTVFRGSDGVETLVSGVGEGRYFFEDEDGRLQEGIPHLATHQRPEPDSWERVRSDAEGLAGEYDDERVCELVRRCGVLAGARPS